MSLERPYIDRDFIEDYSAFYARSFYSYPNYCTRVHCWTASPSVIRSGLDRLLKLGNGNREQDDDSFLDACAQFSAEHYLGFITIRPLHGTPVGRTVLRCFPVTSGRGVARRFDCTRKYEVHLGAITLYVQGLAFQQQDAGVSACATTALWSALQKVQDFESFRTPTPAQITTLASQSSLPFGRAMPSEGLSIAQMCQAVHAVGLSPQLLRAESFELSRRYIYSAIASGLVPVLVLQSSLNRDVHHAVAVAGMKTDLASSRGSSNDLADVADRLRALYIHDDRRGPYLRAEIVRRPKRMGLLIRSYRGTGTLDQWILTHILLTLHPKIRLSVGALHRLALNFAADVSAIGGTGGVKYEVRIARGSTYLRDLLRGPSPTRVKLVRQLNDLTALPRYIGLIAVTHALLGRLDFLVDSTSTAQNPHCVAVVAQASTPEAPVVARFLASLYSCPGVP